MANIMMDESSSGGVFWSFSSRPAHADNSIWLAAAYRMSWVHALTRMAEAEQGEHNGGLHRLIPPFFARENRYRHFTGDPFPGNPLPT